MEESFEKVWLFYVRAKGYDLIYIGIKEG